MTTYRSFRQYWWKLGLLAAPFTIQPACAQEMQGEPDTQNAPDASADVNEIMVVAERRAARLQDIPVAITSLNAEALDRAGVLSTGDLSTVTPGLTFTAATGSAAPFLRGVGNNNVGPGAESSVATYVDGVYYASVSATVFSLAGVQQVDVLKGPQGTLFGRNATGGVIQVTTKTPSMTPGAEMSLSYGNYDSVSTRAYVTGGLAEGLSANLIVGYDYQGEGYGTNLTTGNDTNKSRSFSVRSKLVWEPRDGTSATLAGDYSFLDSSLGISWRPPYGSIPAIGPVFAGGKQDIFSEIDPYYRSRQGGASLRVEQDLGFAELLSISAFRREVQNLLADRDLGLPVATVLGQPRKETDQYSQELQLLGPSDSRVKWVAGVYIFHLESAFDPLTISGPAIAPLTSLQYFSGQKSWSGAIFGQMTIDDILPMTDLTIGGRYTIEQRRVQIDQVAFFGETSMPLGSTKDKEVWRSPTWRLSLNHRFSSDVVAYLSYNRGFKSGTYNLISIPAQAVEPETLDAFEGGLKLELLDKRVRINSALFYYRFNDMQVPRYAEGTVILTNAGKSRMYGLDMDASLDVTPSLGLTAGLALLDAKYQSFEDAVFSQPAPGGGNIVTYENAAGNRLMLAPKLTFNASANYRLPGALDAFEINAAFYHNDGWFGDPDNRLRQASFNHVSAQISWTAPGGGMKITAWGRNLTNEIFAQYLSGSEATSDVYSASAPRTYGLTLSGAF